MLYDATESCPPAGRLLRTPLAWHSPSAFWTKFNFNAKSVYSLSILLRMGISFGWGCSRGMGVRGELSRFRYEDKHLKVRRQPPTCSGVMGEVRMRVLWRSCHSWGVVLVGSVENNGLVCPLPDDSKRSIEGLMFRRWKCVCLCSTRTSFWRRF